MTMVRVLGGAVAVTALSAAVACGGAQPDAAGSSPTPQSPSVSSVPPSPSPSASPSESPAEVDPDSAENICTRAREAEGAPEGGGIAGADSMMLQMEVMSAALAEDAEPALREIAEEHFRADSGGDAEEGFRLLHEWCDENVPE